MSDDERPDVFLQWKNTDACMDFWCACGAGLHFDGYFGRNLTCGHCGQAWELPHKLTPLPVEPPASLKLIFDGQVLPDAAGAEFTIRWPRPAFAAAKAGDIVEIHDEVALNDVASSHRAAYADLLKVQASDGGVSLTLGMRNWLADPGTVRVTRRERAFLIDGLMVLMHQMAKIPENDLSEEPEMQALLERLTEPRAR
jgi:hypothetical protein